MFPKPSENNTRLNITQAKLKNAETESTLNIVKEERDSPDDIIKFINKKIIFESKFDKKGSEQFLLSKDFALYDVLLDDEVEEDGNESYNNISFMKEFTFDKEKKITNEEKNYNIKNQKYHLLSHSILKLNKLNNNFCNFNETEKDKEKISGKI